MATRTETLQGRLALDTNPFSAGLSAATGRFRSFSSGIGKTLASGVQSGVSAIAGVGGKIGGMITSGIEGALAALGIGGIASVAGMIAGVKNALNFGDELSDISARTGMAVKDLVVLRRAFEAGGIAVDSVTGYVRRMNDSLQDGNKTDFFADLGLDQAKLLAMDATTRFETLLGSIRKLGNTEDQQAALSEIFGGKQGIQLMTLVVDDNAMGKARKFTGKMPETMDKNASWMGEVNDAITGIPVKVQQFFTGFTVEFKKELLALEEWITNLDLTDVGSRFGSIIVGIVGMWKDGMISGGDILTKAAGWVYNVLASLWTNVFSAKNIHALGLVAMNIVQGIGTYLGGVIDEQINKMRQMINPAELAYAEKRQSEADAKKESGLSMIQNAGALAGDTGLSMLKGIPKGLAEAENPFGDWMAEINGRAEVRRGAKANPMQSLVDATAALNAHAEKLKADRSKKTIVEGPALERMAKATEKSAAANERLLDQLDIE
jgi:hypothetical protein